MARQFFFSVSSIHKLIGLSIDWIVKRFLFYFILFIYSFIYLFICLFFFISSHINIAHYTYEIGLVTGKPEFEVAGAYKVQAWPNLGYNKNRVSRDHIFVGANYIEEQHIY